PQPAKSVETVWQHSRCVFFVSALVLAIGSIGCGSTPEPTRPGADPTPDAGLGADVDGPLLVTDGWVVTMDADATVIEQGAVAIDGERIVAIGSTVELVDRYPDARRLSADGGAILPGLINTHTHVPMTLFRGMADDLPLMRWLQEVIFPAEAEHVDEAMVRAGTKLACVEMIRGGTTTFVDMYYFEDAIAEETAACGLRAIVGETLIDFPAPDNETWDEAIAYTDAFVAKWKGHPLITPAIAPHAVYTVSAEHLAETHALATQHDVPLLIHLAEHPSEMANVAELHQQTPIAFLDGLGLLDDRVLAAHVVLPTDAEIATLAERGTGVAHCPQSNMKLGAGVAPVPAMLAAGVHVGLGTDGPASNNDLDLWEEIDSAAKLHKLTLLDPTVIDARQALALATIEGARALDMDDEIGSLEVGKRADLVIVGLDGAHQQPLYDLESVLVYATKASDVDSVVVNGRILLDHGRHTTVDPQAIFAEAAAWRDRIDASRQ
ncbi:MAG: amidohydrolase family protein, partial [Acidobacteriota bacterium]